MNPIPLTPVVSSQIAAIGYDPAAQRLAVQFLGSDPDGRVYHYRDFPAEKFAELEAAESKGSFFYAHIKNRFGFDRIEADGSVSRSTDAPTQLEEKVEPTDTETTQPDGGEPTGATIETAEPSSSEPQAA